MIKKNKISFYVPTRKGSERVINKNTKDFAGISGGILRVKLMQILEVEGVDEIILSTNDPVSISVAKSIGNDRIKIIERPEHLCLSSTLIEDLINYIPTIIDNEHIFWVNVTSPLVSTKDYENALKIYWENLANGKHDSLMSVTKLQQFLWDAETNNFANHDRNIEKWPRTQDLKALYEINHAIYMGSSENFLKYSDRITNKPYLFELDKIKSFDIDWEDDFELAELIFKKMSEND
jgi:CMP-N-acetylneuraminic acid synthetase